ncbi:Coenzyme F420 hydrogenase/dehydrogenase, beta subunit C-terminal domain [Patescibacteria group bacterium]|nr:Coenzyme F420 hydrogenase/dehydrogenase, beta subunit C-terminal domain [Patescibacteria group bacterium]
MQDVQRRIREEAKNLLATKRVDLIIGFEKGTLPLRASPVFIHNEDDAKKLVWNCFCENNLATYLTRIGNRKVAVVAKGCDSRSIVALIVEGQIKREQIIVIGIPCQGMVDRREIEKEIEGEILQVKEKNDEILVKGDNFEGVFEKEDYLYPSCRTCKHHNPSTFDILIGERIKENNQVDEYTETIEYEKKSIDERWEYFSKEVAKCIMCYACRQACPMCYCEECFVDNSHPKWIEKGLDLSDLALWHIMRAYHQAGRCVDCGGCERACPMEIDLRFLTKKINKEVKDYFNFEAGLDPAVPPPLATFSVKDRQDFIDSGEKSKG